MPYAFACCIEQFSAVTKSFFALAAPMVRMTCGEMTAGMTPSLTSDSVTCAVFTATAMSQQHRRPTPPPMADPFISAIVNCGSVAQPKKSRANEAAAASLPSFELWRMIASPVPAIAPPSGTAAACSLSPDSITPAEACAAWKDLGSPPAQNMRPLPVSTAMRMSGRPRRMRIASWRPALRPSFIALLAAGRFIVQYAMPSRISNKNSSFVQASGLSQSMCLSGPRDFSIWSFKLTSQGFGVSLSSTLNRSGL
mmetsp:Transcript_101301/g.253974  ORF Transcript_101301/g.253974 Transcript_101301/m.253974 type:complete len:253 (+) Transcript_101301:298-1056(+)